jgi:2-methylcitrate dehydratase PrpD
MSFESWFYDKAARISYDGLTEQQRDLAGQGLSDSIAVAFAGAASETARIARGTIAVFPKAGPGLARVWGTQSYATASDAAFANGVAAHALDWDDHSQPMCGHCSTVLTPALLSLGESIGAGGREVIAAYLAGYETDQMIGAAVTLEHYSRGWHATSTIGSVGAAVAAGKLLGLDSERIGHGIAIAASSACGIRENFGSMVKPLHAGLAARAGVQAALMSKDGFRGAANALSGEFGFLSLFGVKGTDAEKLVSDYERDGRMFIERDMGLVHKPYPCCGSSHPSIDAALQIATERTIRDAEAVSSIVCAVPRFVASILVFPDPKDGFEARYSLPYPIVAALVEGRVGPAEFEFSNVRLDLMQKLMKKTKVEYLETSEVNSIFAGEVTVNWSDGSSTRRRVDFGLGSPKNPMTKTQRSDKQYAAVGMVASEARAKDIVSTTAKLEALDDVSSLTALLAWAHSDARERVDASAGSTGRAAAE